jgi:hypothetical protein
MPDPELREISSIAPRVDPLCVVSQRGFIPVSKRLAECEHEYYGLQHYSGVGFPATPETGGGDNREQDQEPCRLAVVIASW